MTIMKGRLARPGEEVDEPELGQSVVADVGVAWFLDLVGVVAHASDDRGQERFRRAGQPHDPSVSVSRQRPSQSSSANSASAITK